MTRWTLLIIAVLAVTISSCKKEEDDFTGRWNASDSITIGNQTNTRTYSFTIQQGSNDNELLFNGFAEISNGGIPVTLTGNNFTLQNIELTDQDGNDVGFFGSGTFNGRTMTYTYTLNFLTVNQTWTGTATKQ